VTSLFTKRTAVRLAIENDAPAIVDYFARNQTHFARWDPRRPPEFYTEAWWRERIAVESKLAEEGRSFRFFVLEGERVIGMANFANVVRGAFHACHLGFGIDQEREGGGYMREVLERTIAWAWDDLRLHRIEANHRPENTRSAALLRRLGFTVVGYARDYLHIDGSWRDHVLTALVNERWTP
jgi:ribosomal-protein-alanine N-acetyltransferase